MATAQWLDDHEGPDPECLILCSYGIELDEHTNPSCASGWSYKHPLYLPSRPCTSVVGLEVWDDIQHAPTKAGAWDNPVYQDAHEHVLRAEEVLAWSFLETGSPPTSFWPIQLTSSDANLSQLAGKSNKLWFLK